MRCRGVAAAGVLAAVLNVSVGSTWAGPDPAGRDDAHFLLSASTDLWRHGGFASGGVLWASEGLDREGFVLKLTFGGGVYRYHSGALGNAEVTGRQWSGSLMPGWRFQHDRATFSVFAGLDLQSHRLSPDDLSAGLRGNYVGGRTAFELWYEPDATTMLAADATVSSVGPSYAARLAYGWRVFEPFYVGPELAAFAHDKNYGQVRAGIHVTGVKTGTFEWTAGIGWASDSDNRNSVYGKLGVFTRQ